MTLTQSYQVFITCLSRNSDGSMTRDFLLARQLYRKLEAGGITVFLTGKSDSAQREDALASAEVLVVAGVSADALASRQVCGDYDDFNRSVLTGQKQKWRIFTFLRGIGRDDLPRYLQGHISYTDPGDMAQKIKRALQSAPPKQCVTDGPDEQDKFGLGEAGEEAFPLSLPESADEIRMDEDDDLTGAARAHTRARIAGESLREQEEASEAEFPAEACAPPAPYRPSPVKEEPPAARVKPAAINRVEFSAVAPDEVRPGKSSVIDLLMYTRSQRGIVKRTISQAKEKSSEAARSSGSVSVRQGSRVTALLFSDDIALSGSEQTLVWNGDALDFKFRVTPPEDYPKKQIDFGCSVLFDGIQITRLYFTVAVNSKKKAAVRFTRKDCRRAFVSYSHKDRERVVEQLLAIQEAAPKLRFWMDNQSMNAGDVWRSAIASAIKGADVFLLFWSVSAKASDEVRKEWEYALRLEQGAKRRRKNGARFISPVPLDSPSECPPPQELGDLHFGSPAFDSDIDGVDRVRFWSESGKQRNIRFF